MSLGPKQFLYRKSSGGVMLRLGVCDGYNFLTIERPGRGRKRIEIDNDKIDAVEMQFNEIGEDS